MIRSFNLTTCAEDLERYTDANDIRRFATGCGVGGIEVMAIGENSLGIIPPELVTGIHLGYKNSWYDYYTGDIPAVLEEYGSMEEARQQLGETPYALVDSLRAQLDFAQSVGALYTVYHVSNVTLEETATLKPRHDDEKVIDAALEIINAALEGGNYDFDFLVENLWWPGFQFTSPRLTRRLIDGIKYPRKGIMLDLGHLMHTDWSVTDKDSAIDYINRRLDEHGELCRWIRGVHLQYGATGEYMRALAENPVKLSGTYFEKLCQVYEAVLQMDPHKPFISHRISDLIDRIAPRYLTYEFISQNRLQHAGYIRTQSASLGFRPALRNGGADNDAPDKLKYKQ